MEPVFFYQKSNPFVFSRILTENPFRAVFEHFVIESVSYLAFSVANPEDRFI